MKNLLIVVLVLANLTAILTSNVGLRLSAVATNWRGFLAWQIFGNLAGFVGVLAFTGLMRYVPLSVGFGITGGLGFVAVQVLGARLFFHEPIRPVQWLGSALVIVGIALIASSAKA
jgi:multidrug transporter EmrE-like cation transporter